MPIDASIPLSINPLKLNDPLQKYAQAQQLNALVGQQRSDDAVNNAYRQAMGSEGLDRNALVQGIVQAGEGSRIAKIIDQFAKTDASLAAASNSKSKAEKNDYETHRMKINDGIAEIASYDTLEKTISAIDRKVAKGEISPEAGEELKSHFPTDPKDRAGLRNGQMKLIGRGLEAKDKLSKHYTAQNVGDAVQIVASPNYGNGPTQVVSTTPVGVSPDVTYRIDHKSNPDELTDEERKLLADAVTTGRLDPTKLTSRTAKINAGLLKEYPGMDMNQFAANQDIVKNFASKNMAERLRRTNTALGHIDIAEKLAGDLKNSDIPLANRFLNAVGKEVGKDPVTNLQAAAQLVGTEVIASLVNQGGTGGERDRAEKQFSNVKSEEQFAGLLHTYRDMLGGHLDSAERMYAQTGRTDFEKRFLSPSAVAAKRMYQSTAKKSDDTNQSPSSAPADAPQGWVLHQDANGNKAYVSPDGKQFKEVK